MARLTAVGENRSQRCRDDHVADHRRLFRRVTLDLGRTEAAELPTDERLQRVAEGDDPAFAAPLLPVTAATS